MSKTIQKSLGEDIFLKLTLTNKNGDPLDGGISAVGWKFWFGLFKNSSDVWATATEVVKKSTDTTGITVTDAANGIITVHIGDTDTADLAPGTYFAWAKALNPAGDKDDVVRGEPIILSHSPLKNL